MICTSHDKMLPFQPVWKQVEHSYRDPQFYYFNKCCWTLKKWHYNYFISRQYFCTDNQNVFKKPSIDTLYNGGHQGRLHSLGLGAQFSASLLHSSPQQLEIAHLAKMTVKLYNYVKQKFKSEGKIIDHLFWDSIIVYLI